MTYDVGTLSAARLWPYHPDWSSGFEIRRAFLSDIITSRSNREQRIALRDAPRLSASYQTNVQGDDLQAAKHWLRAWQNKPAAVPDFSRYALTTGSSSGGSSSLTIATPPAWIAAGQLAVLCSGGTMELVEIEAVADPAVTLAANLSNAWPSGSVIRPVLFGLMNGALQAQRLTRGAARIAVNVQSYPGSEPPEDEGTASDTFNGYEVFTAEPDFAAQPSLNYLWPVEQVDFDYGRTAQFRPIDRAEQLIEAEFTGLDYDAAQSIEQVFLRAKGSRGAFYRPSGEKDMTLAADASATTLIDVNSTDLADDFGSIDYGANPTAIEICQTNGTRLRRLITAIAVNGGNSRITLNSAVTVATATTARISWMPLVRFASDELATLWRGPNAGTIRAAFQTVKQ